jgi:hypothetical protein
MSMMGRFVQVSPDRLRQIIDDPSGVEELFASDQIAQGLPKMLGALQDALQKRAPTIAGSSQPADPPVSDRMERLFKAAGIDLDAFARGEGNERTVKFMAERARVLAGAASLINQLPKSGGNAQASGKGASISLDKAWHGVHYLLCGQAVPGAGLASQAVMGGTDVGDDLGYGPARYFDAPTVAAIAHELTQPNLEAEMTARWDPDQMTALGIYPAVFTSDDEHWLMEAFRDLRKFYVDAAAGNLAVVTCLE